MYDAANETLLITANYREGHRSNTTDRTHRDHLQNHSKRKAETSRAQSSEGIKQILKRLKGPNVSMHLLQESNSVGRAKVSLLGLTRQDV